MDVYSNSKLKELLKNGGVVVMPTDTIYGLVGSALNPSTVERIYKLKQRPLDQPSINLIGDWNETKKFGLDVSGFKIPDSDEPTTFIIDSFSFRAPKDSKLRELLLETGPLIVPSANPRNLPPARNIEEARKYFGDQVDLYVDGGEITGKASKLVRLNKDGEATIIRE